MPEQTMEIVCSLCSCHFSPADLEDDEILCRICGHSLDDDHAIDLQTVEPATSLG